MSNEPRLKRLSGEAAIPAASHINMQYLLQFAEPAERFAHREHPDHAAAYWGAWSAYIGAIEQAGIVVSGAGLQPPETATTVRVRDGQRQVHDGPYAESKEMIGGFFIIDVPHLDVALEWAARSPAASCGSTEVRPVLRPPADMPVAGAPGR
jgi:hypothetical protein